MNIVTTQLDKEIKKTLTNTYLWMSLMVGITFGVGFVFAGTLGIGWILGAAILMIVSCFTLHAKNWTTQILSSTIMAVCGGVLLTTLSAVSPQVLLLAGVVTCILLIVLSIIPITTGKDFGYLGNMLAIALLGLILVGVVGIFIASAMLNLVLAYIGIVVFSGYILYDVSEVVNGRETNYIIAGTNMYLNVINLFLDFVTVFGDIE